MNAEKTPAMYRKILVYFNKFTDEIKGRNNFYEFLLTICIYCDMKILGKEEFPLWVEVSDDEKEISNIKNEDIDEA